MRCGVVVGILGGVMLALAAQAGAIPGDARFLSRNELRAEAKQNPALKLYLERNGYPDVAEVREHLDSGEWANQTVIIYYLDAHKQLAFGKAHMFVEDVGAQRLDRNMTDEEVAALSTQPSMRTDEDERLASVSPSNTELTSQDSGGAATSSAAIAAESGSKSPADRAEAAALRAEEAAGRVEEAAIRTESAATRAEDVVDKMIAAAKR